MVQIIDSSIIKLNAEAVLNECSILNVFKSCSLNDDLKEKREKSWISQRKCFARLSSPLAAYQCASQYLCDFNSPHFLSEIPRHLTTNLFYQFETFNFLEAKLINDFTTLENLPPLHSGKHTFYNLNEVST